MALARFLDNGILVHTVHDFSEEEKPSLLAKGYYEVSEADLEKYESLSYLFDFETKAPKERQFYKPTLSEIRTAALSRIDSATSKAILAGFEYKVNEETLHFSYDSFDQQNFADTANGALLVLQNVEGIPTSVTWNGYRNHTKEQKGELVRLVLDVPKFLDLYVKGALAHKDTQMELGGKRKTIISNCTTIESIEMYMKSWYGE